VKPGVGLERLEFLRGFFGNGLLAGFEVLPDADAVKASVHPPRDNPVAILKPGEDEWRLIHA
jgi:hypothetical protein